jgi:hypothetical protein
MNGVAAPGGRQNPDLIPKRAIRRIIALRWAECGLFRRFPLSRVLIDDKGGPDTGLRAIPCPG